MPGASLSHLLYLMRSKQNTVKRGGRITWHGRLLAHVPPRLGGSLSRSICRPRPIADGTTALGAFGPVDKGFPRSYLCPLCPTLLE